jgi:hypothetical protein
MDELLRSNKWPCCFSSSDTTGEKPFEEFYVDDDVIDWERFNNVGVTQHLPERVDFMALEEFLDFARAAKSHKGITKAEYVREFEKVIPTLCHSERHKVLDEKM